jgi:tetratricopeptide (TPR) repeat protein
MDTSMKLSNRIMIYVFSILLMISSCSKREVIQKPKIVLLGLDGLDLTLLHELIDQEQLPTFQRLMQEGAYGNLESFQPIISPLIWTSIATGRMPADHGILGFSYQQQNRTISIPSSKRRCAALWNITHHMKIPTTVLGWYATWPSEEITGLIVSDRFVQSIHVADAGTLSQTLPQVTYPEEASYSLYDYRKEYSHIGCEELQRFISFPDHDCDAFLKTPFDLRDPVHHMRLILARNETYRGILLHQLQNDPSQFTMALFDCTDTAAHLFMPYHPPKQNHVSQDDYERYHNAVTQTYVYADALVKSVLDQLNEDDVLMIVSDHGFRSGDERPVYSADTAEGKAVLWHHIKGTVIAYGKGITPKQIQNASVLDVAPTVLTLLNVPVSKEMPGTVIAEIAGSISTIDKVDDWDYTFTPPELPESNVSDPMEVERLQALGYAAGGNDTNQQETVEVDSVENHLNLAVLYHSQNKDDLALQEAEAAYTLNPKHEKVLEHLSALYINAKRYEDALVCLVPLEEMINANYKSAQEANDPNKILEVHQSLLTVYGFLGEAYFSTRQFSDAIVYFRQSLELKPDQPDSLYNLGLCYGIAGQYPQAEKTLESLLSIQPNHLNGKQSLALTKLRQQKTVEARNLLLSIIQEKPDDANLHYLVGQSYDKELDYPHAKEWYEKALLINPNFAKANQALQRFQQE